MKCSNCNTQNESNSKVCINCGRKMEPADNNTETIKAKNIQSKNDKHPPHKRYVKKENFDILTELNNHKIFTAAAIIILGYFFFRALPKEPEYNFTDNPTRQTQPNVPLYGGENTKFILVASKFVCSCGSCGELSLETCGCPTAKQEHKYIDSLLSQDITISQAIIAVANKYGWLKSKYYPQYKVDKSKVWFGKISQP